MCVPNEAALQLAMSVEPTLWRDAMKEGVFISGEWNLTAALRIIHLAWRPGSTGTKPAKSII